MKLVPKILLEGKNINKVYGHGKKGVHAVKDVDFKFAEGEIVSIVGESGSGKTTLAKMIMGLLKETDGELYFKNQARSLKKFSERRQYWSEVQAIFQDPFSSFNEFYKVESLLKNCFKLRGLKLSKQEMEDRMREACIFVNLDFDELRKKHPFELSGGQMQRVMIARIFLIHPRILVADEPTSMIDACSRATILDMLMKLRKENNMTIIFITHDLGLAYYVSDRVFIMEHGNIVERGTAETVIAHPTHPYTKQLISDVPKLHEAWDIG
ncbi:MAG: ABC transporter ATP-binding protein [Clostridia bacterium]|nr:ABC transporter ATP-binding protein [Clostridia bacterium]